MLYKKLSLRFILVVPFALQALILVGLVGYISFRNGQKAVNQLALRLEQKVNQQVEQHLNSYLAVPRQLHQINADAIAKEVIDIHNFHKAGNYFWKQVQVYKDINFLGCVLSNGEMIGAGRWLKDKGVTIEEISTKTNYKAYSYATDVRGSRMQVAFIDNYKPLEDDWYTQTVKAGKPIWSSVYPAQSDIADYVAISANHPIYDKKHQLLGVLNIDLLLSSITNFVNQLNVSPSGEVLIIERNGLTIASSADEKPFHVAKGQLKRLHISNSQDPKIRAIAQQLQKTFRDFQTIQFSQNLEFQFNGERQFVQITPWQDELGLNWLIIVVLPERDFMGEINANKQTTILLCIAALIIAIALGLLASKWIIQPILNLDKASAAIAAGDLEQVVEPNTLKELSGLADSFNHMAQQLRESFAVQARIYIELEKTNEELELRVEQRTQDLQQTLKNLRKAQVQLIQIEKMSSLGQLVAGIAHEINNPVNFIYANLQYASEYSQGLLKLIDLYQKEYPQATAEIQKQIKTLDLEYVRQDLPQIFNSMSTGSERIQNIVLSLRNFSRLDEAEFKIVDIHEGIDSTLMLLKSHLSSTSLHPNIKVMKNYGRLPKIGCYPGQLNQVFIALIMNAIHAIEEETRNGKWLKKKEEDFKANLENKSPNLKPRIKSSPCIQINTDIIDPNYIKISIIDNGIGIPLEIQSKLFDPFFTTKEVGKGTGLGLSISYQIVVQQHEGSLEVNSTPGEGAEFIVTLPVKLNAKKGELLIST
ncbi:MAG: ATP-binding protein [Nostoc sp. ChiSLP02]|nr:ATP-binding protein [Nostoc sp. DedSLP05]MDZ8097770.1 ATP-binding protein [Nostoc sp. DedSLP01]MDZ8183855.1 ATP-binding protein [Nostoc sp. ChiSLP02]